ncbi:BON domain-containing protein [Mucilaginibacter calamicampi]|uniref:BON domain-containing protein n=1 Tax=Mucilaginibacter calamicampi TaxID=1302352 RepID=A0ABW2YXZ6_9SPHI
MKTAKTIQLEVMAALDDQINPNVANIGVSVKNGVVVLDGNVSCYSQKISAGQAVWRISGVRALVDQLIVIPSSQIKSTDAIIAEHILETLDYLNVEKEGHIRLKVVQGRVSVDGIVKSDLEKQRIISAIWILPYINDVIDTLAVKPDLLNEDLPDIIILRGAPDLSARFRTFIWRIVHIFNQTKIRSNVS